MAGKEEKRERKPKLTMYSTPIHIIHDLRYQTPDTYGVFFYGDIVTTTVTADPAVVSRWISDLRTVRGSGPPDLIAGLDVERRHSFYRHIRNQVAVVQICVGRRCLVYHIIHSGGLIPQSLEDFLSDEDYTFVGVGVQMGLHMLEEDYGVGGRARAADLRPLAAEACEREEVIGASLNDLAMILMGKEIEKPIYVSMSDWESPWLSEDQVQYACVDAYVSFEIGRILNAGDKSY